MLKFKRRKYEYLVLRGSNGKGAYWTFDQLQQDLNKYGAQGWRYVKWEGSVLVLEREKGKNAD